MVDILAVFASPGRARKNGNDLKCKLIDEGFRFNCPVRSDS